MYIYMCILITMNIYIKPDLQKLLKEEKSMSGLINNLLHKHYAYHGKIEVPKGDLMSRFKGNGNFNDTTKKHNGPSHLDAVLTEIPSTPAPGTNGYRPPTKETIIDETDDIKYVEEENA